jgi:hypothetical protein
MTESFLILFFRYLRPLIRFLLRDFYLLLPPTTLPSNKISIEFMYLQEGS